MWAEIPMFRTLDRSLSTGTRSKLGRSRKSACLLPCYRSGVNVGMEAWPAHAHNWPTMRAAAEEPSARGGELEGCLDDNAASEFATGALAGTALAKVEGHLASCRDCRELVAALAGTE